MAKKKTKSARGSRTSTGSRRKGTASRTTARKSVGTAAGRKSSRRSAPGRSGAKTAKKRATAGARTRSRKAASAKPERRTRRAGGTGRERTLAQTPEAGRTVSGPTNPMPTKRSTGTGAGAGRTRRSSSLERNRRRLREIEENVPTPPSSLDLDRTPSAARSGRHEMMEERLEHNETSPAITAGDVDADWKSAYFTGDEAPGGDNPTPDQDRVDDIGKALGVQYQDNEELKAADKIAERDRHRWELDPASSEDYRER